MREIHYLCTKVTSTVLTTSLMTTKRQVVDYQNIMIIENAFIMFLYNEKGLS